MLRVCRFPGCETLTLGAACIVHEVQAGARPSLPIGRPFLRELSPLPMTVPEASPAGLTHEVWEMGKRG
jgi:hypothetical protein